MNDELAIDIMHVENEAKHKLEKECWPRFVSGPVKRLMKDKCKVGFRTDRQIVVFEPYRHKWRWIDGIYRYVRVVIKLKYVIIRSDARL
jgi:hypothetical protein